ncbi:MAG: hypothetical protein ACRELB_18065, partial [Polyangiaceae bacterium]
MTADFTLNVVFPTHTVQINRGLAVSVEVSNGSSVQATAQGNGLFRVQLTQVDLNQDFTLHIDQPAYQRKITQSLKVIQAGVRVVLRPVFLLDSRLRIEPSLSSTAAQITVNFDSCRINGWTPVHVPDADSSLDDKFTSQTC